MQNYITRNILEYDSYDAFANLYTNFCQNISFILMYSHFFMKFASTGSLPLSMGLTQTLARDYVGSDSALDTAREELYRALKQLLGVS